MPPLTYQQRKARIEALLARIKARLPELEAALHELEGDEEDGVYRFFHGSFKVFHLQKPIRAAHRLITEIGGESDPPFDYFEQVVRAGTEGTFDGPRTNARWEAETEPILKALWFTKYFLTQMVRHASTLDSAPQVMPSGWAAVLYLYGLP